MKRYKVVDTSAFQKLNMKPGAAVQAAAAKGPPRMAMAQYHPVNPVVKHNARALIGAASAGLSARDLARGPVGTAIGRPRPGSFGKVNPSARVPSITTKKPGCGGDCGCAPCASSEAQPQPRQRHAGTIDSRVSVPGIAEKRGCQCERCGGDRERVGFGAGEVDFGRIVPVDLSRCHLPSRAGMRNPRDVRYFTIGGSFLFTPAELFMLRDVRVDANAEYPLVPDDVSYFGNGGHTDPELIYGYRLDRAIAATVDRYVRRPYMRGLVLSEWERSVAARAESSAVALGLVEKMRAVGLLSTIGPLVDLPAVDLAVWLYTVTMAPICVVGVHPQKSRAAERVLLGIMPGFYAVPTSLVLPRGARDIDIPWRYVPPDRCPPGYHREPIPIADREWDALERARQRAWDQVESELGPPHSHLDADAWNTRFDELFIAFVAMECPTCALSITPEELIALVGRDTTCSSTCAARGLPDGCGLCDHFHGSAHWTVEDTLTRRLPMRCVRGY